MVVQEVLQRRLEPWRWGVQWLAIGSWQWPTKRIIKAHSLTTTREVAQELSIDLSMVVWHLKQIAKVKKLSKWVHCDQTANQKSLLLKYHLLLFFTTTANRFSIGLWCAMKSGFYKKKKKIMLTFWWSAAYLIHYNFLNPAKPLHVRVCTANWCNVLKTATPEAGIGQQKGPDSSL